ncbi:unnamed protein product, partial [Heterosigma akashiwo]
MDVVWLKRDVRLHDHGPLAEICKSNNPFMVLYIYEPDQLAEHSVHGSHIHFVNEGLIEMDLKLAEYCGIFSDDHPTPTQAAPPQRDDDGGKEDGSLGGCVTQPSDSDYSGARFRALTVAYGEATAVLAALHRQRPVRRLLAHMETGHLASYARDRRVRRWCREGKEGEVEGGTGGVRFVEFNHSGVTRRLKSRDAFSTNLEAFLAAPQHPSAELLAGGAGGSLGARLVRLGGGGGGGGGGGMNTEIGLARSGSTPPGGVAWCPAPLPPGRLGLPAAHRGDRPARQRGGEGRALAVLAGFLAERGAGFSGGISSPNSSWSTCSRLSPYLAWGHLALRRVVQETRRRQAALRLGPPGAPGRAAWGRSLGAFLSRLHWRAHFTQKLETEPELERRDQCRAYAPLRRQPGDWGEARYRAWAAGRTGFPFVDACMRCLLRHGWLNFRMRAMLVSFACWNLWLDWRGIAGHLARCFLDYEPGIHYPQLQMQSGASGINAMRVYSVTKQGKDQDPEGAFVRRHVPELRGVPARYVHEPWKMVRSLQLKYGVRVGGGRGEAMGKEEEEQAGRWYPGPIVDEQRSARAAKDRYAAIRKLESTREMAREVFAKHGSRGRRGKAEDG